MLKRKKYINALARLATDVNSNNADEIEFLEKCAYFLHSFPSVTKIDDARSKGFWKVFGRKGVFDLS